VAGVKYAMRDSNRVRAGSCGEVVGADVTDVAGVKYATREIRTECTQVVVGRSWVLMLQMWQELSMRRERFEQSTHR
jgi:hypothetical protein